MLTPVDERLREEVRVFRLRFTCRDCAHFDPEVPACSNGFPCEPHENAELAGRSVLAFCKAFELG
jgi:hypothetical protein